MFRVNEDDLEMKDVAGLDGESGPFMCMRSDNVYYWQVVITDTRYLSCRSDGELHG